MTCASGGVHLSHEFCVDGGVSEDVLDKCLDCCARGVGTCEEDEKDFGSDVFWIQGFTLFVTSVDEAFSILALGI